MYIIRILIFFVVLAGISWLIRRILAGNKPKNSATARSVADSFVPCAHCGVHIPTQSALYDDSNNAYCCPEHLSASNEND